jgi:hypothetical protein
LIIRNCQGIRDISALQNNKKLSIYGCHNISLSTVNFVNVLYLSTDLRLRWDATTTLKHAVSLELYFRGSAVFLSSTVVSLEIKSPPALFLNPRQPLDIDLSNFSQSLKSVLLEGISSTVDLTPLGNIEKVQLQVSPYLVHVNGLGKNNKTVIIKSCRNITDLSALRTVPRVIVDDCDKFVNCEDLNQVQHLTIVGVHRRMAFSGLKRENGCRVRRLELLKCGSNLSFQKLNEIPFLKIMSKHRQSLDALGGTENKIIIIQAKYESFADQFLRKDCYSKTFYNDGTPENNCLMLQLMRK